MRWDEISDWCKSTLIDSLYFYECKTCASIYLVKAIIVNWDADTYVHSHLTEMSGRELRLISQKLQDDGFLNLYSMHKKVCMPRVYFFYIFLLKCVRVSFNLATLFLAWYLSKRMKEGRNHCHVELALKNKKGKQREDLLHTYVQLSETEKDNWLHHEYVDFLLCS